MIGDLRWAYAVASGAMRLIAPPSTRNCTNGSQESERLRPSRIGPDRGIDVIKEHAAYGHRVPPDGCILVQQGGVRHWLHHVQHRCCDLPQRSERLFRLPQVTRVTD